MFFVLEVKHLVKHFGDLCAVNDVSFRVQGLIDPETTLVCETDDVTDLPEVIAGYQRYQHKRYGQTQIHFYGMPEAD